MQEDYYIYPLGEMAITIAFEAVIDNIINDKVMALYQHLVREKIIGVKDIIPAYHTVTIVFGTAIFKQKNSDLTWMITMVETAIKTCNWKVEQQQNIVEIPACYHASLGLDIEAMAASKSITVDELIKSHSEKLYRIFCIGFLPGFAYMGKVDEIIATPRIQTPRTNVAAGSVGIAGEQTGIYPLNSPGGWNIIAQTPLQLFNANKDESVLLKMGHAVKFFPISLDEFLAYKNRIGVSEKPKKNEQQGIIILKQGIADSVQDLGRYGYQHLGINPTGAMDIVAAQIANFLVGNLGNEAVIELHFPTSTFQFQTDAIIALSGADFSATINDAPIPINTPIIIAKDALLHFKKLNDGVRCYLAVGGGYDMPLWLKSGSTNLKANAGGYCGRLLHKNDLIGFKQQREYSNILSQKEYTILPWKVDVATVYKKEDALDIMLGNEHQYLCGASKEILLTSAFTITNKSDRMGYRLHGLPLQLLQPFSLISTAVIKGTIQLLPDGDLIVLMADHQTIGGYPRVAHLSETAVVKLAQMQAHQTIKFKVITHYDAHEKLQQQHQYLLQIQNACTFKLKDFFSYDVC